MPAQMMTFTAIAMEQKAKNHALFQDKLLRKIKALQGKSSILDINKAETMSGSHNCGSVLKGSNTQAIPLNDQQGNI